MINFSTNIINKIKPTTLARSNKATNVVSFGLKNDLFVRSTNNLSKIQIGKRINGGIEADVYEVKEHSDWVLRHKRDYDFDLKSLKFVENQDNAFGVIAENEQKTIQILKKKEGTPLHGTDWRIRQTPNIDTYLEQLKELEKVPNKAFVDYFKQVLNLRSNGYNIDRMNPNNILYDEKNQRFNIVDIREDSEAKAELEIEDLYTFLDGARTRRVYKKLNETDRKVFENYTRNFTDRIIAALKEEGINLEIPPINHNELQHFLIYVYHNDEEILKFYK